MVLVANILERIRATLLHFERYLTHALCADRRNVPDRQAAGAAWLRVRESQQGAGDGQRGIVRRHGAHVPVYVPHHRTSARHTRRTRQQGWLPLNNNNKCLIY